MASTPPSLLKDAPLMPVALTTDISQSSSTNSSITLPWKEIHVELVPPRQLPNSRDLERGPSTSREHEDLIPRPDGGRDAWLFMAGCFVLERLLGGFPFSFGVFETYYASNPQFLQHQNIIAVIGTCSSGALYLLTPISIYILEAWPFLRRPFTLAGLAITVLSLVAASFATNIWHLVLTQGVLYGIGGSMLYSPSMFYLDEWFIHRKGLAFGIMWAGGSTSGAVLPFIITALLDAYGFRTTLRAWSLAMFVLCIPLVFLVKSRTFPLFQLSNMVDSLGYNLPSIFLTSYALSIGLSPVSSTIILALLNLSSIIGALGTGYLRDRLRVTTVIAISTAGTTIAVFLIWGFATNSCFLIIFAIAYGTFAGGFSAVWSGMIREVQGEDEHARIV